MVDVGLYKARIKSYQSDEQVVLIQPASIEDLPKDGQWDFYWQSLWHVTKFDYQGLVKLAHADETFGLVRYSVYLDIENPIIDIEHLESSPTSRGESKNRLVEPIGKWLIWYVIQVALAYCNTKPEALLISLSALEDAVDYYRDKIGMTFEGFDTIAPGEDGYIFTFTCQQAITFCSKLEKEYGQPRRLS